MEKKRRVILALMLMLTIFNYSRLQGNENIRAIQFLSIFLIGAFTAILVRELVSLFRSKRNNNE